MKNLFTLLFSALLAAPAYSASVPFSGPLTLIDVDDGGVYSGTPLGTVFSGSIDDVGFNGSITDGVTETTIDCCVIDPGDLGLSIDNNLQLTGADAGFLNDVAGEDLFTAGMMVDLVDIEGDTSIPGFRRLEVGLSFILDSDAFPDDDPANYPFSVEDVLLGIYFIVEEDRELDDEIYLAYGRNDLAVIPLPAAAWLFFSALGLLGWVRRRRA